MRRELHPFLTLGAAIVGAGLIAVLPVAPPIPDVQARAVELTSEDTADSPLGNGVAFVMSGIGHPTPPPAAVEAADTLYLEPRGFTGTAQDLTTPEQSNYFSAPGQLTLDESEAQGVQIIENTVQPNRRRRGGRREPCCVFWLLRELRDLRAGDAAARGPRCTE